MGVSLATAEFLVEARLRGADYTRTGTIGRQALFVGPHRVRRLLERHGLPTSGLGAAFEAAPGLLDPLLKGLGAEEVVAIDASAYEGADIVHDLNQPIPDELHQRFTTLFDGGTLEHVFDVPTALRSYLQMVEVGGTLIIHTMANNYLGHGFYQFSPELFFRVLAPENGYEVERVVLMENDLLWTRILGVTAPVELEGGWYEAVDPAKAGGRALLQTRRPVVVQVQARRVADVPVLAKPPLQSDYVVQWDEEPAAAPQAPLRERVGTRFSVERQLVAKWDVIPGIFRVLRPWRTRKEEQLRSFRNPDWFRRIR